MHRPDAHMKGNRMNRIEVSIAQLSFTQKPNLMEMLWADMAGNEKSGLPCLS